MQAVRLVRTLRDELGTTDGTVRMVSLSSDSSTRTEVGIEFPPPQVVILRSSITA